MGVTRLGQMASRIRMRVQDFFFFYFKLFTQMNGHEGVDAQAIRAADPLAAVVSSLETLRVIVVDTVACVWALAGSASCETNATTLRPAGRGAARRARGRCCAGRSRDSAGGGRSTRAGNAEPLHVEIAIDRNVVANTAAIDAHQVLTVHVRRVLRRRASGDRLLRRTVGVTKDSCPLLEGLIEVLPGRRISTGQGLF